MPTLTYTRTYSFAGENGSTASIYEPKLVEIPSPSSNIPPPSGYTFNNVSMSCQVRLWYYTGETYNRTQLDFYVGAGGVALSRNASQPCDGNWRTYSGSSTNSNCGVANTWRCKKGSNTYYGMLVTDSNPTMQGILLGSTTITLTYKKTVNVTAGNPIYATDFTNVGLSATKGNAISNGNFTKGTTITASGFNALNLNGGSATGSLSARTVTGFIWHSQGG